MLRVPKHDQQTEKKNRILQLVLFSSPKIIISWQVSNHLD